MRFREVSQLPLASRAPKWTHGPALPKLPIFQKKLKSQLFVWKPQIVNVGQWGKRQCCSPNSPGLPYADTGRLRADSAVHVWARALTHEVCQGINCLGRLSGALIFLAGMSRLCLLCQPRWLQWAETPETPVAGGETLSCSKSLVFSRAYYQGAAYAIWT